MAQAGTDVHRSAHGRHAPLRRLRDPLLRLAFRVGYRLLGVWGLIDRRTKQGVKCVLVQDGQVLLVRHTYGDRLRWELPGGGVKRRERAPDAARREIREELGIELGELRGLGDLFERIDGRRDRLCCFSVEIGAVGLELDRAEIADARWFRPDRLPERRARYVARIVGLALAPLARLP